MWENFTAGIYTSSKNYFFAGKDTVCIIELKVGTCKRLLSVKRVNGAAVNCEIDSLQGASFQNICLIDSSSRDEGVTIRIMGRLVRNV